MPLQLIPKRSSRRRPVLSGPAASGDPVSEPDSIAKGMAIISYLLGGIIFYGGLGFLGSRLLGLTFLTPVGLLIGVGLSLYLIITHYGDSGSRNVEAWVDRKKAAEADWARLAGRPERLGSAGTAGSVANRQDTTT